METALVLFIVAAAFGYMGLRLYRSATSKGGCGCGCQGCKGRKPSACGTAKG
ncbi:MAG: FeoB-associated Cys-rich membrane protein [Desulfovibrio sp.]|nr:FeoB-associated Cys-rich membrane protein [Mailhella sp.]